MRPCHFCKASVKDESWPIEGGQTYFFTIFHCPNCGRHAVVDDILEDTLGKEFEEQRAKIAAVLAERNLFPKENKPLIPVVCEEKPPDGFPYPALRWEDLVAAFPRTVAERLERATANFARLSKNPGAILQPDVNYLSSLTFAETDGGRTFLMQQLRDDGIIRSEGPGMVLSAKGWNIVSASEAAKGSRSSKVGFVAMWFDPSMNKTYDEGLKLGIERSKLFTSRRVDSVQFNGRIDDQIVAEIRRCRFVVADFTGHRPSVYWEAGFAAGLGIPVIYTCKDTDLAKAAFDTRQYLHIDWKDHAGLADALDKRIRATIT